MTQELKGTRKTNSTTSRVNALSFLVESMIKRHVNTAIPVVVTSVASGGAGANADRVTVRALVSHVDAAGNALPMAEMFDLPYCRIQGGVAAVVTDPIPGDIGLAIFAQQDCSNVDTGAKSPVQPGSFRYFDMADGFYIGGFLNQAPAVWLELTQDGVATIHAPSKIRFESPLVEFTGRYIQTGEDSSEPSTMVNGFTNVGGSITSNGVVLETHTHGGVVPGGGSTGQPD